MDQTWFHPSALSAILRTLWRGSGRVLFLVPLLLTCATPAWAIPITREGLAQINQHNANYDRSPNDPNENENGNFWCAPTAAASALIWLSDYYHRPNLVARDVNGKPKVDDLVRSLAIGYMDTSDKTGTTNTKYVSGVWFFLKDSAYSWSMSVYADRSIVSAFDGPQFYQQHSTFDDVYEEMKAGEDDPGAAVLFAYQHQGADGQLQRHATALQKIDNEKGAIGRYPGAVMDPDTGRYEDVGFDSTDGIDTSAKLFDFIAWRDVYLMMAIEPVVAPSSGALLLCGLAVLASLRLAASRRRVAHDTDCPRRGERREVSSREPRPLTSTWPVTAESAAGRSSARRAWLLPAFVMHRSGPFHSAKHCRVSAIFTKPSLIDRAVQYCPGKRAFGVWLGACLQ